MSDSILVLVCEVNTPPYEAVLSVEQIQTLLDDSIEVISPATVIAGGNECPLSGVVLLAGGNAQIKERPPVPNRFGLIGNIVIAGPRGYSIPKNRIELIRSQVQSYDNAELSRSFRIPSHAMTAPAWEMTGNKWHVDAHFTGDVRMANEMLFINSLLIRYADHIVAYFSYRPFPIMYSLEIQFRDSAEAREQAQLFLREYQAAFTANGKLKKAIVKTLTSQFRKGQV